MEDEGREFQKAVKEVVGPLKDMADRLRDLIYRVTEGDMIDKATDSLEGIVKMEKKLVLDDLTKKEVYTSGKVIGMAEGLLYICAKKKNEI